MEQILEYQQILMQNQLFLAHLLDIIFLFSFFLFWFIGFILKNRNTNYLFLGLYTGFLIFFFINLWLNNLNDNDLWFINFFRDFLVSYKDLVLIYSFFIIPISFSFLYIFFDTHIEDDKVEIKANPTNKDYWANSTILPVWQWIKLELLQNRYHSSSRAIRLPPILLWILYSLSVWAFYFSTINNKFLFSIDLDLSFALKNGIINDFIIDNSKSSYIYSLLVNFDSIIIFFWISYLFYRFVIKK